MKTVILAILVLFSLESVKAQSFGDFMSRYVPHLNGRPYPNLPVASYVNVSNIWEHPSQPNKMAKVELRATTNSDITHVILRFPDGRMFTTQCDNGFGVWGEEVYSGDFNGDGLPDFMAIKGGTGCGLAAEYCTGVFAFSGQQGYRFTRIHTMGLGPQDLIIDPATKSFRLIHTSFCSAKSLDGRDHSFWVHRFFLWDGSGFQVDPKLSPVWIQYLNRPNHEPTKLLTSELKAKAWAEDSELNLKIEW